MDFSKALESLSHEILLKKLNLLNFSHSATECIESFSTKRLQQQVTVNGMFSDWIELQQGVPQGTMLRPLLFNLYVKGLSNQFNENAHIIQSADGCLLYGSDSELEIALNRLQENGVKLQKYFAFNRLNLNDSQTEIDTFSRKNEKRLQNSETVVVGSSRLEKSNQCKYLGLTIDKHLDLQTETKKVLKKTAVGIKTIGTIQHEFPTTLLFRLFQALVSSHFELSALFRP